jgi:hypothetical protein
LDEIKILWVVIFFVFTLVLIFTWSKIIVMSRKMDAVLNLLQKCNEQKKHGETEDSTS